MPTPCQDQDKVLAIDQLSVKQVYIIKYAIANTGHNGS